MFKFFMKPSCLTLVVAHCFTASYIKSSTTVHLHWCPTRAQRILLLTSGAMNEAKYKTCAIPYRSSAGALDLFRNISLPFWKLLLIPQLPRQFEQAHDYRRRKVYLEAKRKTRSRCSPNFQPRLKSISLSYSATPMVLNQLLAKSANLKIDNRNALNISSISGFTNNIFNIWQRPSLGNRSHAWWTSSEAC